jgi:catechol 2,3-dioxygenase-like lactoylglutathione lyase family enzyme
MGRSTGAMLATRTPSHDDKQRLRYTGGRGNMRGTRGGVALRSRLAVAPCATRDTLRVMQPREEQMVALSSVVHFSIPVSDVAASTRFYTEIVGLKHLATVGQGTMAFLDAAGVCVILVKRDPPINPRPDNHGGVHHSFGIASGEYQAALDHLRARGVEITFEEDRQGGVINGPRAYFLDPDGTVLEFIDLTSYAGNET